jgi:hypothetical protein
LRKATISFVMSVRPPVRMEQLGSHLTDFLEIWYLNIFWKNVEKISSSIKLWQEQRVLCMETNINFWSYLALFFLERDMFQRKFVAEIETQILCSITICWKSCCLWDNVENYSTAGRAQMTIWRMRISCWMTKVTHTPTKCNIYCFSTGTIVAQMRLTVTLYLHCLSCYTVTLVVHSKWQTAPKVRYKNASIS